MRARVVARVVAWMRALAGGRVRVRIWAQLREQTQTGALARGQARARPRVADG